MPRAVAHGHAGLLEQMLLDAAVSSVMWGVSDALCQCVEMWAGLFPAHQEHPEGTKLERQRSMQALLEYQRKMEEVASSTPPDEPKLENVPKPLGDVEPPVIKMHTHTGQHYDTWRTTRFAIVGVPSGIWLHAWFRLLDSWFPEKTLGSVTVMALVDWVGECPYILSNMSLNAYLDGGCKQVRRTIRNDYWPCNLLNLVFWFPMDILMFMYIPVEWQLLTVRAFDLIYLPVDSYFANRSIPKPGVDSDSDASDDDEPPPLPGAIRKSDRTGCTCAVM
eukprot:Sspe_Gene.119174::Locus_114429_Transcript_1_1_Confidence_1.000_Length_1002::g.119174::m.119174/K13348/MPV17; protein Mpv17